MKTKILSILSGISTNPAYLLKFTLLLIVSFFCSGLDANAQNPDIKRTWHWYFGNGAGIDFSSGSPVPYLNGKLHTYEGCSSISDTLGNLLFYTDGDTVWNKNHQSMPNGKGLMGCGNHGGSSENAGLIVPQPGSNHLFYIFTTDCSENSGAKGVRYSIVDLNFDGGLGDVIVKNKLLFAPSIEGIAATKNCNGYDFWITSHEFSTNNFRTYQLTALGIDTVPIVSSIGIKYTDYGKYLNFSPNGRKLAIGDPGSFFHFDQLFDFDNSSGHLCSVINLHGQITGGICPLFSPDNSKLYFTYGGNVIYQYDLLAGSDSASISNSWQIVANNIDNSAFGTLQNGPNGKIYVSSIFKDSISTIDNPNQNGALCNFKTFNLYMGGAQSELGIPVFIQNYFGDTIICKSCSVGISEDIPELSIQLYPNPTNGNINLIFNHKINSECYLKIFSLFGILVKEVNLKQDENTLDVSNLSQGFYMVKIYFKNQNLYSKKLIINKP